MGLALAPSTASQEPESGAAEEFEPRWQAFRVVAGRYRSAEDPDGADALEAIAMAPDLLERLANLPEMPVKRAAYLCAFLSRLFATSQDAGRDALEEARVGDALHAFALRWGEPEVGGEVAYWVANDHTRRGRLEEAREVLTVALAAHAESKSWAPFLHVHLADLLRREGRWEEARASLTDVEAAIVRAEWPASSFESLQAHAAYFGTLGQLELDRGLPDRAVAAFEEERLAAEALAGQPWNDTFAVEAAVARRMELYLLVERFGSILREAQPMLERPGIDPETKAMLELQIAIAHAGLEQRDPARPRRARPLLEGLLKADTLDGLLAARAQIALAAIALDEGRFEEAGKRLGASAERLARSVAPETELVFELAYQRAFEARHARLAGAPEVELAERLRALVEAFDRMLDVWADQSRPPGGIGFLHLGPRRLVVHEVVALCLAVEGQGPEKALEHVLRAQANGTLSRRLLAKPCSYEELRATLLADRRGALVYQPSSHGSHLLLVDASGVAAVPLAEDHVLDGLVREVRDRVTRPPGPDPEAELAAIEGWAEALGKELFPEAARERVRSWDHVFVSDGGQFSDVPWEVLPLGDGATLGLSKPLSYLASLPLGAELAQRETWPDGPKKDLVLLGMPAHGSAATDLDPALVSLPAPEKTLERLRGPFPAERVSSWSGPDATRAVLMQASLGEARVLHFFCHGVFDSGRERPAGLVLAPGESDGGLLWSEDVERLPPMPPLVVLSACGAARGHARFGEDGVSNLGGAFLYRGARDVVLASASVEYAATVDLIEAFQRELAEGKTVARALLEARRAVARERPHPYYHSLLRVVGPGDRPLF